MVGCTSVQHHLCSLPSVLVPRRRYDGRRPTHTRSSVRTQGLRWHGKNELITNPFAAARCLTGYEARAISGRPVSSYLSKECQHSVPPSGLLSFCQSISCATHTPQPQPSGQDSHTMQPFKTRNEMQLHEYKSHFVI